MDAEIVSVPARPARHTALVGAALPEPHGRLWILHCPLGSTTARLATCASGAGLLAVRMRARPSAVTAVGAEHRSPQLPPTPRLVSPLLFGGKSFTNGVGGSPTGGRVNGENL